MSLNNYDKAIEDFNKAIKLDSSLAVAYNNRGSAYSLIKNYNKAIEDFSKAIKLNPDKLWLIYYSRGNTYNFLESYEKAIEDWEKAIELNPGLENELRSHVDDAKEKFK